MLTYALIPGLAVAQTLFDRDANVGVLDRPHPEYDALGIRVDSFVVFPKVSGSVIYDDNIFALSNKTSDTLFVFTPEVQIQSNWNRHSLQFDLSSEFDEYAAHGSQNTVEYQGTATGRLDVDHGSQISLVVAGGKLTQPRTSQNTIEGVLAPVQYDLLQAHLTAFREFNRLKISSHVDVTNYSYYNVTDVNGNRVSEDYQDHLEVAGTLRADYAVSPTTAIFLEATPDTHIYRLAPPQTQFQRNSDGVMLLSGLNFQVLHLLSGEIGVGYQYQHYDDPQFNGVNGLALRGKLTWYPTQLLTVTIHGDRTAQDSGLPNTAAAQVTDADVSADYELLRNLIITARLGYTRYDYPGLDRRDDRYAGGLGATYLINRSLGLTLGYSYIQQNSTGSAQGFNFNDNRLMLTVTIQR